MKIKILLVSLLLSTGLTANDANTSVYVPPSNENNVGVRIGIINGSGKAEVEAYYGSVNDITVNESGVEIGLFSEAENELVGFRPVVSLIIMNGEFDDYDVQYSNITLMGEFEGYLNLSQYFKPFIGVGAGFGSGSQKFSTEKESVGTIDFRLSLGATGDFNENIGYYIKLNSNGRVFKENSYGEILSIGTAQTVVGISIKF